MEVSNIKLEEFDLLTLRECLYRCRKDKELMTETDFNNIERKIKGLIEELV